MTRDRLATATNSRSASAIDEPRAKALGLAGTGGDRLVRYVAPKQNGIASTLSTESEPDQSFAETRSRARALARAIPEAECAALFAEHGELVDKMEVEGALSARERARLAYVRWQLDRVEDARIGENLDALERLAGLHEAISRDLTRFVEHVQDVSHPSRKRQR